MYGPDLAMVHAAAGLMRGLVWVLILAAVLMMVTRGRRRRQDPVGRAVSVLNERYARGEIDRDEYLERRAYLE